MALWRAVDRRVTSANHLSRAEASLVTVTGTSSLADGVDFTTAGEGTAFELSPSGFSIGASVLTAVSEAVGAVKMARPARSRPRLAMSMFILAAVVAKAGERVGSGETWRSEAGVSSAGLGTSSSTVAGLGMIGSLSMTVTFSRSFSLALAAR
jgi:hypothetical protein